MYQLSYCIKNYLQSWWPRHFGQGKLKLSWEDWEERTLGLSVIVILRHAWWWLKRFDVKVSMYILSVFRNAKHVVSNLMFTHIHMVLILQPILFLIVGCGELWVTDGIWRLNFPHCMYQVKVSFMSHARSTERLYNYTYHNSAIHQWNAHTQSSGRVHRIT